jgi:hypothetical protein
LFRVLIGDEPTHFPLLLVATALDSLVNAGRDLSAHHGAHEAHQPFGFAQIAPPDGLHHDQKCIVHLVVQLLNAKLAAEVEADAMFEDSVQLLHARIVAALDLLHHLKPLGVRFEERIGSGVQ